MTADVLGGPGGPKDRGPMDTRVFCAYNLARGAFLSSKVTVADCANQPLQMLRVVVSSIGLDAESALWLTPLNSVPAVPRLFPFDLVYLDNDHRVLERVEVVQGVDMPVHTPEVASALVLPFHSVSSTQTQQGDRLIVCLQEEVERLLAEIEEPGVAELAANAKRPGNGLAKVQKNGVPHQNGVPHALEDGHQGQTEASGAKGIPAETAIVRISSAHVPPMAISEVELEGVEDEQSQKPPKEDDAGDIFANWIVSPAAVPAWIEKHGEPVVQSSAAREPVVDGAIPPAPVSPAPLQPTEAPLMSTEDVIAQSVPEVQIEAKSPEPVTQLTSAGAEDLSDHVAAPSPEAVPAPPDPAPVRMAIPQPAQAAASTFGQYGMWRVSAPTAVGSASVTQGSSAGQVVWPAAKQESSNGSVPAQETAAANTISESEADDLKRRQPTELTTAQPVVRDSNLSAVATPKVEAETRALEAAQDKRSEGSLESSRAADQPSPSIHPKQKVNGTRVGPSGTNGTARKPSDELAMTVSLPRFLNPTPKGKLRISIQKVAGNGKNQAEDGSLMSRFQRWLNPVAPPSDRRRAHRRYVPGMVAYYYTGGAPKPYEIADISMSGFYLMTEDRWMPETMIQMTLQKPCARGERKQSITVLAKIVRKASDGVAAEFVMPESLDPNSRDIRPTQTTDRFSLARFL